MSAGSFPELFLQYFAWGIYNILWDVFLNLGIVYLPFGFYLFEAFTDARKKGTGKKVAKKVLHNLEVKLFLGVVVLTLAGVPTITLNLTDMRFNNRSCTVGSKIATMLQVSPGASGTGTELDAVFTTSNMGSLVSKAPVAWMAVLSIGQAISDAVRVKVPCKSSISEISYQLQTNKMNDPKVRQEVGEFYNTCYRKARAKFDSNPPASYTKKMMEDGDVGWLGSDFFMTTPGFYDTIQADRGIPGFIAFTGSGPRDAGWWNGEAASKPAWSRPFCKEWYQSRLRSKIINSYDSTASWSALVDQTQSVLAGITGSKTDAENALIRGLIDISDVKTINNAQNAAEQVFGGTGYGAGGSAIDALNFFSPSKVASQGVANAGTFAFNTVFYPTMEILKKALPLVHAFVLAGLIMFLPFLLILSQYGIKEVLTMSALLISIKFWPVIWTIGEWMEASLQSAILPSMMGFNGSLTLGVTEGLSINDDVLDYVIGAWYIMGPILLSTVITLAGHQTGQAVNESMKANKSGDAAGKSGGDLAKNKISKGR